MTQLTTYTYDLTREQQVKVLEIMDSGNYRPREVPYSLRAVEGDGFTATLYSRERHNTRKFCVQGSKAQDFILTPGRYVGIEEQEEEEESFDEKMKRLTSELADMFIQSNNLQKEIKKNLKAVGYEL